jgi:hypothetical protein
MGRLTGLDVESQTQAQAESVGEFVPRKAAALVREAYDTYLAEGKGFLPATVPLDRLPQPFTAYLLACHELPARFDGPDEGVRGWLDHLFTQCDPAIIRAIDGLSAMECEKLMTVLCALAHTYRWDTSPPDKSAFALQRLALPEGIDKPWTYLARRMRQPRVGSLWNLTLCNWSLTTKRGGSEYSPEDLILPHLRLAHGWLLPPLAAALELWVLTFVETEARGVAVVQESVALIEAAEAADAEMALHRLERLNAAVKSMNEVFYTNVRLSRLDPGDWVERIQPTFRWGLDMGEGPLEGGSGLQLGSIQCVDGALDVPRTSLMATAAVASRTYMPEAHREFLAVIDAARPVVRRFVQERNDRRLTQGYNDCVKSLRTWRHAHLKRGALYLQAHGADRTIASTGLTISLDDDPLEIFTDTMRERIDETTRATLPTEDVPGLIER